MSKLDRCSLSAANSARLVFPALSISPKAYWSSMGENKAQASDSAIHPHSPTGKALIDADNVPSFIALSLRASGGVWVPKAALIVSHIPMTEPYIGVLRKSLPLPRRAAFIRQTLCTNYALSRTQVAARFQSERTPDE